MLHYSLVSWSVLGLPTLPDHSLRDKLFLLIAHLFLYIFYIFCNPSLHRWYSRNHSSSSPLYESWKKKQVPASQSRKWEPCRWFRGWIDLLLSPYPGILLELVIEIFLLFLALFLSFIARTDYSSYCIDSTLLLKNLIYFNKLQH